MATSNHASTGPPVLTPTPQYTIHDKQKAVLESNARYRTLAWGRRGGKNICAAIDLIEYARNPAGSQWGADEAPVLWWVGPTYQQAKKYGFDTIRTAIPDAWIDGDPKRSAPYEIALVNGTVIEFRTFDKPESLQGAGVDRMVIDEAAYMPRSLWDNDLEPMLMDNRGCVMFISKPFGRNWFFEMYERGESLDFPHHDSFHATSSDNPFIDEDPSDKRDEKPDRVYKQEYLAEFIDDSGGVFEKLDERLFTLDQSLDELDGEPPYAHGWDLARHQDWTVGITLDSHGRVVAFYRQQDISWPQIQRAIVTRYGKYDGPVMVDASRDNKLVSDLADEGLPVRPIKFSPKRKRELIENLATRLENGELASPDIPQLRHELGMFGYDVTPSGNVRYHAPEGFHDDAVDALAMAADALDHLSRFRDHDNDDSGVSFL